MSESPTPRTDDECRKCGCIPLIRDGCDPTPLCDECAHEEVDRLERENNQLRAELQEATKKQSASLDVLGSFHKKDQSEWEAKELGLKKEIHELKELLQLKTSEHHNCQTGLNLMTKTVCEACDKRDEWRKCAHELAEALQESFATESRTKSKKADALAHFNRLKEEHK